MADVVLSWMSNNTHHATSRSLSSNQIWNTFLAKLTSFVQVFRRKFACGTFHLTFFLFEWNMNIWRMNFCTFFGWRMFRMTKWEQKNKRINIVLKMLRIVNTLLLFKVDFLYTYGFKWNFKSGWYLVFLGEAIQAWGKAEQWSLKVRIKYLSLHFHTLCSSLFIHSFSTDDRIFLCHRSVYQLVYVICNTEKHHDRFPLETFHNWFYDTILILVKQLNWQQIPSNYLRFGFQWEDPKVWRSHFTPKLIGNKKL